MRTEYLVESKAQVVAMSPSDARRLTELGVALASNREWWGQEEHDETVARRSIRCDALTHGKYRVMVPESVGVIGLDDLLLVVQPKIPMPHFLYLLGKGGQLPRHSDDRVGVDDDDAGFYELLARWYLSAAEQLLRRALVRDYRRLDAEIPVARGAIRLAPTIRALVRGRVQIHCSYDEFTADNSLNRVLRGAACQLMASRVLPDDLRRRARRIEARLGSVGTVHRSDLAVVPGSHQFFVRDAHRLACALLLGRGVAPATGKLAGSTFLFRTPDAIEEGIRRVLNEQLPDRWQVRKHGRVLDGSHRRTLNPDLVFGQDDAIGDVKYRLTDGQISRSDLGQITLFATGYHADKAVVVAFGENTKCEQVRVGSVDVRSINWNLSAATARDAGNELSLAIERWLNQSVDVEPSDQIGSDSTAHFLR